ncbi:MAG TPA: hypothetical protein VF747_06335 [Blastocatellia bacterium]|jgi:hypothetical protein
MPQSGAAPSRGNAIQDYVTVAERIEKFYERFPEGRIITNIIEHERETGFILFQAMIYRNATDETPCATGHAYEMKSEGHVQRTSYIEVGETSAVGRALAMAGFEVRRGIASREEMSKASRADGSGAVTDAKKESFTEENWQAGEGARKNITDKELVAAERTGKTVHDLRGYIAEKYKTREPWALTAQQVADYGSYLGKVK